MSYSSIWLVDNEFNGRKDIEFDNSWWFSPIVMDVLFHKYMPDKSVDIFGNKSSFLTQIMFDESIGETLNILLSESDIIEDRILWELVNQQMFNCEDKNFISDCIIKFIETNKEYMYEYGEHIIDRFKEISNYIKDIKLSSENSYFIFKNTNCDDDVEILFKYYNEETDKLEKCSIVNKPTDDLEISLVIIEDNNIDGFVNNLILKDIYKFNKLE